MSAWPNSLIREIAERRVVFFIGAGISKAAHSALPTWSSLLNNLAQQMKRQKDKTLVAKLVRQGSMLDAAQIIRDDIPKADFSSALRTIFQIRPVPHHTLYEDILKMDPKVIITTNYDEMLEKNFEHYSGGTEAHSISRYASDHLLNDLRSPIRSIIKIHGCITDPSKLILDRQSYFALKRDNSQMFHVIQSLMTVNTVLFIGYSLSDPDIQLTLENINIFSQSQNPHYALVSKFEHNAMRVASSNSYNISFIEYPSNEHQQVPNLIADLCEQVHVFRTTRGIV